MNRHFPLAFAASALALTAAAALPSKVQITAEQMAFDNVTGNARCEGNVVARADPFVMTSPGAERTGDLVVFRSPTEFTSCTNAPGHRHWSFSGGMEYLDGEYAILRNVWLRLWNVPVLWIPAWYYPIEKAEGWRVMPGYTSRWGAYVLSKYVYHIAGDRHRTEEGRWLFGNTRFDLRWKQGFALGESLSWSLGQYGRGGLKAYYAWDDDGHYSDHFRTHGYRYQNWGSSVPNRRWGFELTHDWEVTERDRVQLAGAVYSDSHFRRDFFRNSLFNLKSQWLGYDNSVLAWEHLENAFLLGVEVSGPLNDFATGVAHLPEVFLDVAPTPLWTLPVNYESESTAGYYARRRARYGSGAITAFSYNPGEWAEYDTFRVDTYHRFTLPMKWWDVLSVVPRLAWRGTFWGDSGYENLTGSGTAGRAGSLVRTIYEAGATFAARGTAEYAGGWSHLVEPYLDFLAQQACYSGLRGGARPYVFDLTEAANAWEDQFAGRSRNLPWSYTGITPGVRNAWTRRSEDGQTHTVFDCDLYAALEFDQTDWTAGDRYHRLAEVGRANYGRRGVYAAPGIRLRWLPAEDMSLAARLEYDTDYDKVAMSAVSWTHTVSRNFNYYFNFRSRDHRWWDFSSSPYSADEMASDDFNWTHFACMEIGCEQEVCDALAWGPFVRWDWKEGELDSIGAWFDYRTDCLGFRLSVGYENDYRRLDGSEWDEEWNIGFYVYLRTFGPSAGDVFH